MFDWSINRSCTLSLPRLLISLLIYKTRRGMVMWQVHGSEGTTPTILYVNKNFWSSSRDGGPPEAAGQAQSTFLCFLMRK